MAAMLSIKLAQGGASTGSGYVCPAAQVMSITAHKKPGKAVVRIKVGRRHGRVWTKGGVERYQDLIVIGDWKKLTRRWKALKEAG